jgi:hypothetical protein
MAARTFSILWASFSAPVLADAGAGLAISISKPTSRSDKQFLSMIRSLLSKLKLLRPQKAIREPY